MYDSMTDTQDSRPSIYWFDEVESTMTKVSPVSDVICIIFLFIFISIAKKRRILVWQI